MVKVILSGACGQMGLAISRLASRRSDLKIVAGLDKNSGGCGFNIYQKPAECTEQADVLIDFSHPSALSGLIDFCVSRKMPMVVGTTGLSAEQVAMLKQASAIIPVFYSSNMSTGMLFLHKLIKLAAGELYGRYDIEITEAHHNQKVDAPSGTALALFNTVKSVVPDAEAVYERQSCKKKRSKNEVGMHSVRGGGIIGTHEVLFAGANECITISHTAFSKDIFAEGALDASVFLASKPAGFYNMENLKSI